MKKRELAYNLLSEIEKIYPNPKSELVNWDTPFQFLVCIILSAQTTDIQVNKVTKELFDKYPDGKAMAKADIKDIKDTIGSINFFNNKAKFLIEMSKILNREYKGIPPKDVKELQKLPGVGYKTANVFLNDLYQLNQGVAVDTHVLRVAKAYGLSKDSDPDKVAKDLEKIFDRKDWYKVNSLFVLYGRYILKAKKPALDRVVKIGLGKSFYPKGL
jgi:endonuclease-3